MAIDWKQWRQAASKPAPPQKNELWTVVGLVSLLPLLMAAILGFAWIEDWIDSTGVISHTHESLINVTPDWLVGESKTCHSYPGFTFEGRPEGYAQEILSCVDGDLVKQHRVRIRFFGREIQQEYSMVEWKCRREPEQEKVLFTCYEFAGAQRQQ